MLGPPRLWACLTREWCPLPSSLAWTLWRAIVRARWSGAVEWRTVFLDFARRCTGVPSRAVVTVFFAQHCAPHDLMTLIEALVQEQVLLRRDGRRIEEILLGQCDAQGAWKHQRGRQPVS
jgi:hypothetical protein